MQASKRKFIALASLGITAGVIGGCGSKEPDVALSSWHEHGYKDIKYLALSYAILAPSAHNLQSWNIKFIDENELLLYCNDTRLLPQTDPFNRQTILSQGTFLEFYKLAAQNFGYRCEINLLPNGKLENFQTDPIAKISLYKDASIKKDPLFNEILNRSTNRNVYKNTNMTNEQIEALASCMDDKSMQISFTTTQNIEQITKEKNIAKKAWEIEFLTPATALETYKYLRIGSSEINKYRDGICINNPVANFMVATGILDRKVAPKKDDFITKDQLSKFDEKIDSTNSFLFLTTLDNSRQTQIKAGMEYARLQLMATKLGLAMHPLSQALQEYKEQDEMHKEIHKMIAKNSETIQMWCRIGTADGVQKSPRKDINSFVIG